MVIIFTTILCDHIASTLSNLGSNFSYISKKFSICWDLDYEYLGAPMYVSTSIRVFLYVNHVYHACFEMFMGFNTLTDLFILDIK